MLSLPDKYIKNNRIALKPFLDTEMTSAEKRRFKDSVLDIHITYQIEGFDIPNLVNDEYNCQAIAFIQVKLDNLKNASFVSKIIQKFVKSYCVIQFVDNLEECYSFAMKRLNKQDKTQIVIEDTYITGNIPTSFDNQKKTLFSLYIDYGTILNRDNKVAYYAEMMTKAFLIFNSEIYANSQILLDSKIWYSFDKTLTCFKLLNELKETKTEALKITVIAEKSKINKQIKSLINKLEELQ